MSTPLASPCGPTPLRQDARTIGLIGLAHGTSHFFHMLLPPLFPLFIRDFGLSYSELGLLVSTFFVISGIGQALAGFLVDRVGAKQVLLGSDYPYDMGDDDPVGLVEGMAGLGEKERAGILGGNAARLLKIRPPRRAT